MSKNKYAKQLSIMNKRREENHKRDIEEKGLMRNSWDSARERSKKEGFVGIGTFERNVSGQYAVSDKELKQEKRDISRARTSNVVNRTSLSFMAGLEGKGKRPRKVGRFENTFQGRIL